MEFSTRCCEVKLLNRQRFRTPEPKEPQPRIEIVVPVTSEPTPPTQEEVDVLVSEAVGDVLATLEPEPIPDVAEAIVGSFNWGDGIGVARITRTFRREGFAVIRVNKNDVVTEGDLRVGRVIRFRVAPPDPDGNIHNAREIEIYKDVL